MKRIETKSVIKIAAAVFVLFLCIYYWSSLAALLGNVLSAAMPLIIGCIAAYPMNILMSFYERHFFSRSKKAFVSKIRTPVCLILAIITLLAVVALIIALIVPQLVSCVKLLIAEIPGAVGILLEQLEKLGIVSEDIVDKLAQIDWQSRIQQIVETVFLGIGSVMGVDVNTVTSVVSGITTALVAIIFTIYLLAGKYKLGAQCRSMMKRYIKEERRVKIEYVLSVVNDCFHRFIVGQCTEAVILGVLCTVGMLILGLPYAPMIGAVIAFTALIPMVGAFIGGGIGAFLIMMESPMQALIFVIFLIILQQLEGNLIYPRVVGSSIGLPAIWVLAAVTIGGGVFGIFGMLIGVPIAASCYRLLREHVNNDKGCGEAIEEVTEETAEKTAEDAAEKTAEDAAEETAEN
ncbi:MAG: AI-2E family transporter [Clostridia bacterium]|nr:AI-2E family transporter [Clostridia bacterium]